MRKFSLVLALVAFAGVIGLIAMPHSKAAGPYASALEKVGAGTAHADCANTFCLNAQDPCSGAEIGVECHIRPNGTCINFLCGD